MNIVNIHGEIVAADAAFIAQREIDIQPAAPTIDDYSHAIGVMLDGLAQQRQYDSILTAVTYLDDPNPAYAAEAAALKAHRSAVWTYALAALQEVQAGERSAPSIEAFLVEAELACPFTWPT